MPGILVNTGPLFKHIVVQKLHPTFGAQVNGVDFSTPLTDEVFGEVLAAVNKVCPIFFLSLFLKILSNDF